MLSGRGAVGGVVPHMEFPSGGILRSSGAMLAQPIACSSGGDAGVRQSMARAIGACIGCRPAPKGTDASGSGAVR